MGQTTDTKNWLPLVEACQFRFFEEHNTSQSNCICHLHSAHRPLIYSFVLWSLEIRIELPALRIHQQRDHKRNKNSSSHMVTAELELAFLHRLL